MERAPLCPIKWHSVDKSQLEFILGKLTSQNLSNGIMLRKIIQLNHFQPVIPLSCAGVFIHNQCDQSPDQFKHTQEYKTSLLIGYVQEAYFPGQDQP